MTIQVGSTPITGVNVGSTPALAMYIGGTLVWQRSPFTLTGTLPNATVGTAWTGVLTFAGDYTGTITIDASTGTIPAWMGTPTIDTTAKTITWSATPAAGTDAGSPYAFTPRATASGGQVAVGPAQSVAVSAAGGGFTDNFATPASSANWTMSLQGTAGGAYAFNTGNMTMTPAASQKNSVAMRHTGPFTTVSATIARATNPGTLDYTTLALGTGNVTTYNNDNSSWQITTIQYGYSLVIRAPGNMTLYRCNGSGANTTLATKTYTDSTPNAAHVYQLVANGSGVTVTRDGVTLITSADTTYSTGGDILIAQGEYTTGVGGIATLTQVTAS